ncbi:hypothetical protein ACP70R_007416 [Stipagrostis hirtigluma subsp. patula]
MAGAPRRRPLSSWSDIPVELAGLVLRRLPAHVDRVRFAAVCPQWRAATRQDRLPPPLPLLAVPDGGAVYSVPRSERFRFPACVGYDDACGNWMVFSNEDGCFLRDAFSNATMTLPALSRARLRHVGDEPVDETGLTWTELDDGEGKKLTLRRLMFCSSHLVAAFVNFLGHGTRFAVCRPGPTSWWSVLMDAWFPLFFDMAFHQGKLYAIDRDKGNLFCIDVSMDHSTGDAWVPRIRQVIDGVTSRPSKQPLMSIFGYSSMRMLYLVESSGLLLMVQRRTYGRFLSEIKGHPMERGRLTATGQIDFAVFKADFQMSRWTKVTTIGDDRVLFLQQRCSRSVCVSQCEMPGDCIVFIKNDDNDSRFYNKESLSYCSVYDMSSGKISTYLPMVSWARVPVLATWLLPQN